jgi:hypothetical protein
MQMPDGYARMPRRSALLLSLLGALVLPASAHAGVAVSTAPDLPGGARAGTSVKVKETGVPGSVSITQIFTGADAQAIARVDSIQLSPACGPGPSPGNPDSSGPALNTPEVPCSNPDPGVFGGFTAGTGGAACAGNSFGVLGPDANGQLTLLPAQQIYLTNGQTCSIAFTFNVRNTPTKDTFPSVSGMNTTSVSAVRSEIVANPGNPGGVGLEAAALGSGGTVLVEGLQVKGKLGAPPKLRLKGVCVNSVLRASVSGTGIDRVTYLLDDRVVKTVKKKPFKLHAEVGKLRKGRHELKARLVMKSGSSSTQVLTRNFFSCRGPSFTG